jgi:hypothetical protein
MLTVMWSVDGFHTVNLMTSQSTLNSHYFVDSVLTCLPPKIFPQGRWHHALRLHCHFENCPVHFLKASEQFSLKRKPFMYLTHGLHPSYTPDLAPSNFWIFGHVKATLVRQAYGRPEELLDTTTAVLREIQMSELKCIFQHSVERVRWVLSHNGDSHHE